MEQTKNIKLVQGYLKKSNINIVDLIGVVTMIILTKDIFKKNSEVGKFINEILNESFHNQKEVLYYLIGQKNYKEYLQII